MDLSNVDPTVMVVLFAAAVVSGICTAALKFKRRGLDADAPYDTVDKVLWVLGIPLLAVVGVLGIVAVTQAGGKSTERREGDDDLAPDEEPTDPNAESRGEQVARVIEENAEKVEKHVLEEATDDEVGARGAALFGLGPKPDGEDAIEEDPTDPNIA